MTVYTGCIKCKQKQFADKTLYDIDSVKRIDANWSQKLDQNYASWGHYYRTAQMGARNC